MSPFQWNNLFRADKMKAHGKFPKAQQDIPIRSINKKHKTETRCADFTENATHTSTKFPFACQCIKNAVHLKTSQRWTCIITYISIHIQMQIGSIEPFWNVALFEFRIVFIDIKISTYRLISFVLILWVNDKIHRKNRSEQGGKIQIWQ